MLDKPSGGGITTSSKVRSDKPVGAQALLASAVEGWSAIYAFAAKLTLQGLESFVDRRAEKRAERLARTPTRSVATTSAARPPQNIQRGATPRSAPKRAPKSR
jgi:hypothetical protein